MTTDFIGFAYSLVIIAGGVMGLLTKGNCMFLSTEFLIDQNTTLMIDIC